MPKEPVVRGLLARPKYVVLGDRGQIKELFCKVCGLVIGAEREIRVRPGVVREGFQRFRNYAETKMECADGSAHVTCLCDKCAKMPKSPELLAAILEADMTDLNGNRKPAQAKLDARAPTRQTKTALGGRAAV